MEPRSRRICARLLLGIGVAVCAAWLASLDYAKHVSTDILDLMPVDDRQPDLVLVRQMASQQQARAALFALQLRVGTGGTDDDHAQLAMASETFVAALRRSSAFAEVAALDDPELRDEWGGFIFRRRFDLLLPEWLQKRAAEHATVGDGQDFAAWLGERTAADLETFMQQPDALGFEAALPADPLLLLPRLIDSVQGVTGAEFGGADDDHALIWARVAASPLTDEGQAPVFAAVDAAAAAMHARTPNVELQWTAVSRFAAESRRRIRAEISLLNVLSFLAVLTVGAFCLRRVWQLLHLAPGVICSFLGAWTVTTLIYDRVHVLVFVIGALLGGIASDYGLHVYLHPGPPGEDFNARLRAVRRPLIGSAVTAMIGFSALLLSDLPLIRQIGVFVLAGLVTAMVSALLWFAQVRSPHGELRPRFQHGLLWSGRRLILVRRMVVVAGLAVIVGGIWRVHWRDDIRDLDIHAPELWENDRAVRAHFGERPDRVLFLARGDSPAAARGALARFADWLQRENPEATLSSVGLALPSPEAWTALPHQLERLAAFEPELRAALERHGFDPGGFEPFFTAWREFRSERNRPGFDALVRDFAGTMRGPAGMLFAFEPGTSWFAIALDGPVTRTPPPDIPVVPASQLQSLNGLFGGYRQSALRLSLVGLTAACVSVLVVYGLRRGPTMILIPLGACLCAFGTLGLAGLTLNLFHLLGAFLALCLCFDYAIFTGDRTTRGEQGAPPSVRLSALNTAAAFGVLAFSRIPVVAALGLTVSLIAVFALLMVEIDLFPQRRPQALTPRE